MGIYINSEKKKIILLKLIKEIISFENNEDYIFAKKNISEILYELETDKVFKNLIYMSKNKISSFAFTYSKNFHKFIKEQNIEKLKNLLNNASTPEYDNNKYLTNNFIKRKNTEINEEILALNFAFDEILLNSNLNSINFEDVLHKCKNELNIFNESLVWIDSNNSYMCFELADLLILISTTNINPYTNELFSNSEKEQIVLKYKYELLLIKKYLSN